jgi:hypothetical protein
MRTKRFSVISMLFLVCLVLAASAAEARILGNGVRLHNPNPAPATVTYSWSGHFGGGGEV